MSDALEMIVARWNSGPLEFFITAAMPFVVLCAFWFYCLARSIRLPVVFYPLAILCSIASLLYAPVCGCMGVVQTMAAAVIALVFCAFFFAPFAFGAGLAAWRKKRRGSV